MFNLDGKKSHECELASRIIVNSSLFREFESDIAVTVYRQIPEDSYWFITAMAGVHQTEPMYGPKTVQHGRLYDFAWREKIRHHREYRHARPAEQAFESESELEKFRVYLSLRCDKAKSNAKIIAAFEKELLPSLRELLRHSVLSRPDGSIPSLYPDIWNVERRARDEFRQAFRNLPPLPRPGDVLGMISNVLGNTLKKALEGGTAQSEIEVVMYLPTTNSLTRRWSEASASFLSDVFPISIPLPAFAPNVSTKENEARENVLTWAFHAARPLFFGRGCRPGDPLGIVSSSISDFWKIMLEKNLPGNNSGKLLELVASSSFQGLSVVPIPDLTENYFGRVVDGSDPQHSMGILVVHCKSPVGVNYFPAQHFLVCRLARVIASYLTPLLPLPGYPRWSEHMWRGGAKIENPQILSKQSNDVHDSFGPLIAKFIESLMPDGATVHLEEVQPGFTAVVYKLNVKDLNGVSESSRIIKISQAEKILKECENYFRFIHNKRLGSLARIDVSQCLRLAGSADHNPDGVSYGAVVYHFVEKAISVEEAIKRINFSLAEVADIIHKIAVHMADWWSPGRSGVKAKDLFLTKPFCSNPPWSKWNSSELSNDRKKHLEKIRKELIDLNNLNCAPVEVFRTLMHGDLHFRNIFAVGDSGNEYALIDWGEISDDGHAVLDCAHMLVDARYRVCWKKKGFSVQWMKQMLTDHMKLAPELVHGSRQSNRMSECYALALLHKMIKYYVMDLHVPASKARFISDDAARQLYLDINTMISEIRKLVNRATGNKARSVRRTSERAHFRKTPFGRNKSALLKRILQSIGAARAQMRQHVEGMKLAELTEDRVVLVLPKPKDRMGRSYFEENTKPVLQAILRDIGFPQISIVTK